jgi:hypothetical protein
VIGTAAADAVEAMWMAVAEYLESGHGTLVWTLGGTTIARVYELQQATLGQLDFAGTVRREGKRVMFSRHAARCQAQLGIGLSEAFIDELIDGVLEIVAKVADFEVAFPHSAKPIH